MVKGGKGREREREREGWGPRGPVNKRNESKGISYEGGERRGGE